MERYRVSSSANGRMVLPAILRQQLHVEGGGLLVIREDEGRLVLESVDDAIRCARQHRASPTSCWPSAGPTPCVSNPASNDPVVLDASAVLALLFEEPGAEVVRVQLRTGVIGAANLAEVLAKLSNHGLPVVEPVRAAAILGLEVVPMTERQAGRSAELRPLTRTAGLSPGDRACLALAAELGATALTADRGWGAAARPARVRVQMIR